MIKSQDRSFSLTLDRKDKFFRLSKSSLAFFTSAATTPDFMFLVTIGRRMSMFAYNNLVRIRSRIHKVDFALFRIKIISLSVNESGAVSGSWLNIVVK